MTGRAFLFDVDDTLLDNDRFGRDLHDAATAAVGDEGAAAYFAAFEARRAASGFADYLGAAQQCFDASGRDPRWLALGSFMLDYPFVERLYPGALEVLAACARLGPVWLVSDGDAVMQPHKLRRSGLWQAVGGKVLIYIHKETRRADIERHCPADHYVMVDDKIRILQALKATWGERVTTVQPQQGHYARDADSDHGRPDIAIARIRDLLDEPILRAPAAADRSRAI